MAIIAPVGTRIGLVHGSREFVVPAVVIGEHWTGRTIVETLADPEFAQLLINPAYPLAYDPNYRGCQIVLALDSEWLPAEQCTFERVTSETFSEPTLRQLETYNPWPEITLNTPFLPEAGENTSPNIATLDDATLELLATAEAEATRYVNGERAQGKLALEDDDDEPIVIAKGDDKPVERKKRGRPRKVKQDDWTDPEPVRVSENGAQEIAAAVEAD